MGRRERPVDPTAGPLEAFAFDLRMLRVKAGEPSYRKLAQRAGFSASALSAAAAGVSLPSRQVTLAYVAACGADVADWARRWETLRAQRDQQQTAAQWWSRPGLDLGDEGQVALVDAVWQTWIHGVLRSAVGECGLIAPRLIGSAGRTTDIAGLARSLHGSCRIVLVGQPGIGKTIASLALTRELIVRGADPTPVVIQLQPMLPASAGSADWLCDEICRRYGISQVQVKSWLASGRLLPVLDGLDTLRQTDRVVAANAINAIDRYLVTCRTGVYEMVASILGPYDVINVQPLSMVQVQEHLSVGQDPQLADLLTVPAFLAAATRLPQRDAADRTAVCAAFVRTTSSGYPAHRAMRWLSWMAQFSIFDPRRPQVGMLAERRHRWLARSGVRAIVMTAVLAVIGAASWLATQWWRDADDGLAATSAVALIAVMVSLTGVMSVAHLQRVLVLWLLVRQDVLPVDVGQFLHGAHCAGLLDETREGYRFAHPQLRWYFLGGRP